LGHGEYSDAVCPIVGGPGKSRQERDLTAIKRWRNSVPPHKLFRDWYVMTSRNINKKDEF
jgi:hypothetical protein